MIVRIHFILGQEIVKVGVTMLLLLIYSSARECPFKLVNKVGDACSLIIQLGWVPIQRIFKLPVICVQTDRQPGVLTH